MKHTINRKLVVSALFLTFALAAVACGNEDTITSTATPAIEANQMNPAKGSLATMPGGITAAAAVSVRTNDGESLLFAPGGSTSQVGIWVNGQANMDVEPDMAVLRLGVESRELTVAEARDAAAEAMTAVQQVLLGLGVAEDDIATTSFSINPQINWIEVDDELGRHREPRIIGYIVSNSLEVKIRDLDTVGQAIDTAAEAGGNLIRINSVDFTVDDPGTSAADLRRQATADAITKAQLYADAAGVQLGPLVYLNETGSSAPVREVPVREELAAAPERGATTPISGGDISLSTNIQAAFSIVAQ